MDQNKKTIKQWSVDDRPREKVVTHGISALSNAELLAILIGSGNREESAVELTRHILADNSNRLSELGKRSLDELCGYNGIGQAKAVAIMAAVELAKRRSDEGSRDRFVVRKSSDIYDFFFPLLCDLATEECWVLLLNQASKVIDRVKISAGGIASTAVDIRCVLREALLKRAVSIALTHNHPSGNIRPSREDDNLTLSLQKAARMMNIRMIDHLIITDGAYYSYADEGRL